MPYKQYTVVRCLYTIFPLLIYMCVYVSYVLWVARIISFSTYIYIHCMQYVRYILSSQSMFLPHVIFFILFLIVPFWKISAMSS